MEETQKPFACKAIGCGMSFTNEDHLNVHTKKHDMSLNLGLGNKSNTFVADQTPTPTRFIRNCDEVGLFEELQLINPFDMTFKRAVESKKNENDNQNNKNSPNNINPSNSHHNHHHIHRSNCNNNNGSSILVDLTVQQNSNDDTLHTPHVFPHYIISELNEISTTDEEKSSTTKVTSTTITTTTTPTTSSSTTVVATSSTTTTTTTTPIEIKTKITPLKLTLKNNNKILDEQRSTIIKTIELSPSPPRKLFKRTGASLLSSSTTSSSSSSQTVNEIKVRKSSNEPDVMIITTKPIKILPKMNHSTMSFIPQLHSQSPPPMTTTINTKLVIQKLKDVIEANKTNNNNNNNNKVPIPVIQKLTTSIEKSSSSQIAIPFLNENRVNGNGLAKIQEGLISSINNRNNKLLNGKRGKVKDVIEHKRMIKLETLSPTSSSGVGKTVTPSPQQQNQLSTTTTTTKKCTEQNRAAARRYRSKRKIEHEELVQKYDKLEIENNKLKNQVNKLQTLLAAHENCPVTKAMSLGMNIPVGLPQMLIDRKPMFLVMNNNGNSGGGGGDGGASDAVNNNST